jgi:hypothetical protein
MNLLESAHPIQRADLLTKAAAERETGVSLRILCEEIKNGALRTYRVGRREYLLRDELLARFAPKK